jgi:hypothetical protein
LEVQDSGLYLLECSEGHKTATHLEAHRFEILFELALSAIVDGYNREAVASFAAALERFYEFYVRVICAKRKIDQVQLNTAWKDVSKQSERQLGAYVFMYLLERSECAPKLPQKMVEFRNGVIHKGNFPTRLQAVNFGQAVLDAISPVFEYLKRHEMQHIASVAGPFPEIPVTVAPDCVGSYSFGTYLTWFVKGRTPSGIEDAVESIKRRRIVFGC